MVISCISQNDSDNRWQMSLSHSKSELVVVHSDFMSTNIHVLGWSETHLHSWLTKISSLSPDHICTKFIESPCLQGQNDVLWGHHNLDKICLNLNSTLILLLMSDLTQVVTLPTSSLSHQCSGARTSACIDHISINVSDLCSVVISLPSGRSGRYVCNNPEDAPHISILICSLMMSIKEKFAENPPALSLILCQRFKVYSWEKWRCIAA